MTRPIALLASCVTKFIAFLICLSLLLVAWTLVGLDEWIGVSANVLFELVFIPFGIASGAMAFRIGRCKIFLLAPCTFVLFVLVLPFIELSPVKPAVRAVHEIRAGMSESEVRAILERHFPEHGRFKRPQMGDPGHDVLCFALDPDDGRYNAAVVRITFAEGKCVTAQFHPD